MTLPRFFAALVGGLAVMAGLVLTLVVRTASLIIIGTGEAARTARAAQVAAAIDAELSVAEHAVEDFEQALSDGIVDVRERPSVRRYLATELIALRSLTDLTLTAGALTGYGDDGQAVLAAAGRWQASAFRERAGGIEQRLIDRVAPDGAQDPTRHDTFRAAASRAARGRALWSDVAFTELDAALPPGQRRKTMTVQKAIFAGGPAGHFVGVLRAGLVSETLDRIGTAVASSSSSSASSASAASSSAGDPHRIFICDAEGRLVTRLRPDDSYAVVDREGRPDPEGDLRVVPAVAPPLPIAAALDFARENGRGGTRMLIAGVPYLVTVLPVAEGRAQQWLVGVVVPESAYVGPLARARDRLLALLALVVISIAGMGVFGARTVGRGVKALVHSTEAMRHFSFQAAPDAAKRRSPFTEIQAALDSEEQAKTALRAMVKYVPIDLVRRLYESGRDPVLGAELTEISIMFTDIADFTTHAEALPPGHLAEALGRYLEVATRAVEAAGGTVDKYIGDALMVLWNAPEPVAAHATAACRAALACEAATAALGGSEWWRAAGLPPWRTRFGLHTDHVLVGNFGAPDRLTYTAMGDGVNLASRLEGLNKIYGTRILVSEEVRRQVETNARSTEQSAEPAFVFREVDRVAVKGKVRAVRVYELVGVAGDPSVEERRPRIAVYEQALHAVLERRFEHALALLADLAADGPAAVLAARCHAWLSAPPPADWDGTWTATTK